MRVLGYLGLGCLSLASLSPPHGVAEEPEVTWNVTFDEPRAELLHPTDPIPGEPEMQKLDLVILGDGYTRAQMPTFREDALRATKAILAEEPFKTYAAFLRIWRVNCISEETGAAYDTRDATGAISHRKKSTCFGAYYGFASGDTGAVGRALQLDAKANTRVVFGLVPGADAGVVIVNDPHYGGAADPEGALVTTWRGPDMGRIVVHELGHGLAGLSDEYAYGSDTYSGTEPPNPNVTVAAEDAAAKWAPWIAPAGAGSTGAAAIGRVEGGMGSYAKGVFRPTAEACCMRNKSQPYCAVCREALVRTLWEVAKPVFASGCYSPPDDPAVLRAFADHFVPASEARLAWFVNGEPRPATGSYELAPGYVRTYVDIPAAEAPTWAVGVVLDETPFLRIPRQDTGDPREFDYAEVRAVVLLEAK